MPRVGAAWTLWAAAALLVLGGLAPFVFGGTTSRVDGVLVPFLIGAVVFALCVVLPNQSRGVTALLYFVGGLVVVYGLLNMFALPVRLAVLGTCPVLPNPCTTGLPRPLTDGENTGMGVAAAFGIVAIFLGFFGLVTVYRRTAPAPSSPPVRSVPPVAPAPPVTPAPPPPSSEPVAVTAADDKAADVIEELPAPDELPELPPHESGSSTN